MRKGYESGRVYEYKYGRPPREENDIIVRQTEYEPRESVKTSAESESGADNFIRGENGEG